MPYIYVENLEEGQEEANVYTQEDIDKANERITELEQQRDTAIERAVDAENKLRESKEKYANTFFNKSKAPEVTKSEPVNVGVQTLEELFGME
jgi:hypothetical protein